MFVENHSIGKIPTTSLEGMRSGRSKGKVNLEDLTSEK
jgi:hypothetical protein